jgi:hypothetical protein
VFCNSPVISLQQKVPNLSNRGSQTISSPLAIKLKGFFILKYFKKDAILQILLYNNIAKNLTLLMRDLFSNNLFREVLNK